MAGKKEPYFKTDQAMFNKWRDHCGDHGLEAHIQACCS